jgi:5-methylcytosine-specific restriction endonuclease McrA
MKKIEKCLLEKLAMESFSFREIILKLNMKDSAYNYYKIQSFIVEYKIDTSHFLGKEAYRSRHKKEKQRHISEYLKLEGPYISSSNLKKKLILFGLIENKCKICKIGPEWNNMPLTLQLDHIDGNRKNNNIDNLRILCPNCHTQTDTYGGKTRKNKIIKKEIRINKCIDCSILINPYANRCVRCAGIIKQKVDWPSLDKLEEMVRQFGYRGTGRILGVREGSVKKRISKLKASPSP